jgi:antimicrobial peptide system SdpB family protein
VHSLHWRLSNFEWRGPVLAWSRSMLAVGQLSILAFNSDEVLFPGNPGAIYGSQCRGITASTLWCAVGTTHLDIARAVAMIVLVVTISGYRAKWTCVPHWYISFSLGVDLVSTNGGDQVAQIVALLLVPMLLGDRRAWLWQRPILLQAETWRGAAYAAHCFLRIQVSVIYLNTAISKLLIPAWLNGTAMGPISHHPYHGFPQALVDHFGQVLNATPVVATLTWGTIAIELTIAILVFGPARWRFVALILAVALHAGIALLMGLPTFALTMVCLVALAWLRGGKDRFSPKLECSPSPIKHRGTVMMEI